MRTSELFTLTIAVISWSIIDCRYVLAQTTALSGKSVVVTWIEERTQRIQGMRDFRPAIRNGGFSAYVSGSGRIFSRTSMARGGASGATDRVGNEGKAQVALQGRTMIAVQQSDSGARRISIVFGEGFDSCSAQVIRGKQTGASSIVARSVISGNIMEIGSVKTSGESCSVKNGNIFGND